MHLQYHDTKCKILLFHIFRAISIISSLCLLVDDSVMVFFSAACFSHWLLDSTTRNNWQNKPRSSWEENISDKQLSFVELERDKALVEFTHSSLDNLLEGGILCAAHLGFEWIDGSLVF